VQGVPPKCDISPSTEFWGPHFRGICVFANCNTNTLSFTYDFGDCHTNDIGLDGKTFFTGSKNLQVKEVEVLEITD
jgi:hypothetical protein